MAMLGDGERGPCLELLRVRVVLGDAVLAVGGRARAAAAIWGRKGRGGDAVDVVGDVVKLKSMSDFSGLIWNSWAAVSMIS